MRFVLVLALAGSIGCVGRPAAEPAMFAGGDAYERFMGRWGDELAPLLVRFTGVHDGDRILDVGAGTGALSRAAEAMLPASEIVGIDPSEGLLAVARRRARTPRVRFEVGDAQALRYADASFDAAMAQLVLNFVPDHERALREMVRVTRPGGRLSACVWDYGEGMEMLRIFWDAAAAIDPVAAAKDERTMKLSRRGELAALWQAAGLASVEESMLVIEQRFTSFDGYWTPFLAGAGPAGEYVRGLDPARREALRARLHDRIGGAVTLHAGARCVRGTKSALP